MYFRHSFSSYFWKILIFRLISINAQGHYNEESIQMHYAEDAKVIKMESRGTESSTFLYVVQDHENLESKIYLIEIPSRFSKKDISINYLGMSVLTSADPVFLSKRTFILLSEVEDSIIFEIQKKKRQDNPSLPHLREIQRFPNLGIITSVDKDPNSRRLLVQSFKKRGRVASYQKGLQLQEITRFPSFPPAAKLQAVNIVSADRVYIMASFQSSTKVFFLGNGYNWIYYPQASKSLQGKSITFCEQITGNYWFLCGSNFSTVAEFQRSSMILTPLNIPHVESPSLTTKETKIIFSSFENLLVTIHNSSKIQIHKYNMESKTPELLAERDLNALLNIRKGEISALHFNGYVVTVTYWFDNRVILLDKKLEINEVLDLSSSNTTPLDSNISQKLSPLKLRVSESTQKKINSKTSISSIYCTMITTSTYLLLLGDRKGQLIFCLFNSSTKKYEKFEKLKFGYLPLEISKLNLHEAKTSHGYSQAPKEFNFFVSGEEPAILTLSDNCSLFKSSLITSHSPESLSIYSYKTHMYAAIKETNSISICQFDSSHLKTRVSCSPVHFSAQVSHFMLSKNTAVVALDKASPTLQLYSVVGWRMLHTFVVPHTPSTLSEITSLDKFVISNRTFIFVGISSPSPHSMEGRPTVYQGSLCIVELVQDKILNYLRTFQMKRGDINGLTKLKSDYFCFLDGESTLQFNRIMFNQIPGTSSNLDQLVVKKKEVFDFNLKYLAENVTSNSKSMVLVSDFFWTVNLYKFETKPSSRLIRFCKVTNMFSAITQISMLPTTSSLAYSSSAKSSQTPNKVDRFKKENVTSIEQFVLGDEAGNLFVYRFNPEISKEHHTLFKAEEVGRIHIGESTTYFGSGIIRNQAQFQHSSLQALAETNETGFCVLASGRGSIQYMTEIPRTVFNLFKDLQTSMRTVLEDENTPVKRDTFRQVRIGSLPKAQPKGIIDGSFLKQFVDLDEQTAAKIMQNMRYSDLPDLTEIRSLLRFFERSTLPVMK